MRNKFEALTAFQSWPEDWQRLCAEYWTENDKPNDSHQAEHFDPDAVAKIASSVKAIEASMIAPVPSEERFAAGKYTPRQEEYLVRCCHENRHKNGKVNRKKAAVAFLVKYPGRNEESVREKARVLENRNWKINY